MNNASTFPYLNGVGFPHSIFFVA